MPQFTQWNVPNPFPNILYNPAAVDAAIAKTQSELGNLDINRQELKLKQDAAGRDIAFGDYLKKSLPTDGTMGTTGAGIGPLADAAPDQSRDAAGQAAYNWWVGKGLAPHHAAGMAAQEVAESGGRAHVVGDGGAAIGGYQHHPDRRALILAKTGIDMTKPDINAQREGAYWELMNSEHGARKLLFAATDPDQAGRAATEFERPDSKRRHIIDAERGRDARRIFQLANPNGAAGVATASVDPRAGPRVGLTPPPAMATVAPPTAPGVNPNAAVRIPPPAVDPNARVEADDPNTAAVKQASAALLAMPEPDAAAAYPAVVRELQARGFAMNAPPAYPGHAALQALVGGGEAAAPGVAQTKTAMRLNGTDVAGPPGVVSTPTDAPPNRLAYGTDLPGVTIGLPTNGMAPPVQAAAAAPAQAQPQATRPPLEAPPPAPSRVIQREPLIQSGIFAGLTRTQAATIANTPGVKPAQIMDQIATARHQNDVIRQGDATQAAIDEKENYARRHQSQQDQITAAKAAEDRADKDKAAKLAEATSAREAAKAHDEILNRIGGKKAAGIPTTPDEDRLYAGSYYAKQQEGATATTMDGPDGQKIPVLITRRLPKQYPEPEGGALPLVVKSPDAPTTAKPDASQSAAAGYADRMQIAVQAMEKLDDTSTYFQKGLEKAGSYTGYSVNSSEYEQLRTAQKAFLGAILKRESGAEVKDSEFERDKGLYFPQPGESVETANLKKRFRQAAMEATIRAAGEGYKPASAVTAPTPASPASKAERPPLSSFAR